MTQPNQLGISSKPLFFRLDEATGLKIEPAGNRLGEAVRIHVRSIGGMQKEALAVATRTGATWRLASDEGAYLNGHDEAPCPLSFLTTGMVSSTMEELLALARQRKIELGKVRLSQDNYYTMKGSALKGTMIGGAKDVAVEAQIECSAGREAVSKLVADAIAASPVSGLMNHQLRNLFSLCRNGNELGCNRVSGIPGAPLSPVANETFEAARPAAGDFSALIERGGPTPGANAASDSAGSSLRENQDRILHVRGICTIRADGLKQIEQHLYNPPGSVFYFLSDEAPINGGQGLAPDAATYISAGIAFCFMTQLGRYANIAGRPLADYRIVQDTHFSPGGASGHTGRTGEAGPIETHLQLETSEDDDFARTALDMAEQTCFLHALCRDKVRTRIKISNYA